MTYLDALTEARALAHQSPLTDAYVARWNALEDALLGKLSIEEANAMRAKAEAERGDVMAAGVILCVLDA